MSPIEVGELLCDTLADAEDAAALSFALLQNETVTAEKSYYAVTNGEVFTDGIGRKVCVTRFAHILRSTKTAKQPYPTYPPQDPYRETKPGDVPRMYPDDRISRLLLTACRLVFEYRISSFRLILILVLTFVWERLSRLCLTIDSDSRFENLRSASFCFM